jgi:GAF domain-containing protein
VTAARAAGIRTICGSPLRREGKSIGALIVYRDRLSPFTPEELALQQSFADQAVIAIENARLFNETQEALEQQRATAAILSVINTSGGDLNPVFDRILEYAHHLCGAPCGSLQLIQNGRIMPVAIRGMTPAFTETLSRGYEITEGNQDVLLASRPVQRIDLQETLSKQPDDQRLRAAVELGGLRTLVAVPLIKDGVVFGRIVGARQEVRPFSDKEIALMQSFADQAVIAIENTRLFNETQEALARQTATSDILRVISQSPTDVQPVFDAIVSTAVRLLRCDMAFFLRCHGSTFSQAALVESGGSRPALDLAPVPIDPDANFPSRAIVSKKNLHLPDWSTIDLPDHERQIRVRYGINSSLFLPLLRAGECVGLLAMAGKRANMFGESEIALAESFRDQALIAIENTRLFNETQEALERQTATAEILKVIAASPSDVQPVFEAIVERSTRLVSGFSGAVHLLIDGQQHLKAFTRISPEADAVIQAAFPRPLAVLSGAEQIRNGEIFEITDTELEFAQQPSLLEMGRKRGYRSLVIVPLLRNREPIGLINVTRREAGRFAAHHVDLLRTFADQAVIAIENTRLFNETQEALERQTATADILKVIASSPSNVAPVFEAIATSANRLLGGFSSTVFRFIDGIAHLEAFTPTTPDADEVLKATFPRPVADFPPFQMAQAGEVTQIPDTEALSDQILDISRARGFRSMLFTPLMNDGVSIGFIAVTRIQPGTFADHHVQLLQTFADQAVIAIENARLFNEVQARTIELTEALEQQTATSEVLSVISSSAGDLAPVFDAMLGKATQLCGANFGLLNTFDGHAFHTAATHGLPPAYDEYLRSGPLEYGPGSAPARLLQGEPIVEITDLAESEAYREGDPNRRALVDLGGARSVLAVPLLKDDRVVGNFFIFRQENRLFSEKQITLLQQFAAQAVIAIENTRLLRELRQSTDDLTEALTYQTGSANILKVIASSPTDVEPVLQAIVESACELCEAYDAIVRLKIGDSLDFSAHHGPIPVTRDRWPISPNYTAGLAIIEQRPVHVHDLLSSEGDQFPEAQELARSEDHRTILSVPLLREGESIGAIVLRRTEVHPFSDKQIALLQTFADQAVIAIGNVRLFDEVQAKTRDLEESLQFQTASSDVLKVISRSPDALQPVFDAIVETSRKLCRSQASTIFTLRDGRFHVAAFSGIETELLQRMKEHPIAIEQKGSALARSVREKRTIHIPNTTEDPEFAEGGPISIGGARATLTVPLMRDGEVIGSITLRQSHLTPYTPRQIEAIETFADQAVIAISNVNLFDEVQQRTRELSKSLEDLRAAQDRLIQTEKLASLGQLTAGIAHEIKNPLNFVNNFAALSAELTDELKESLRPAVLDETIRSEVDELTGLLKDNLGKVVQHGKRADSIVKNMLLHSREGSGEHRPADINALVDESLNLAYHGARAEKPQFNVTLTRDFDPDAGMVEVFPQEITRVLLNLISNGFYAVAKRKADHDDVGFEPQVTASTKGGADHVEIRIRDNGTGIPPEVREKMFNPFFTTKPAGEGTGLGLSMSHDIIVKQHGGSIDVETEPGAFTEFRIVLRRSSLPGKAAGN